MAQTQSGVHANLDRHRHLLHARSGGHRIPPAPSRRTFKTPKETISGIWRLRVLKPKSATRSGQRITTSTPNIISDRCPQTQKGPNRPCCDGHLRRKRCLWGPPLLLVGTSSSLQDPAYFPRYRTFCASTGRFGRRLVLRPAPPAHSAATEVRARPACALLQMLRAEVGTSLPFDLLL